MCGIAGVYLRDGLVQQERLQKVAAVLRHRGPDGVGTYIDENVGLVHARLAIIDLLSGQQPLHNADKTLWLVANGEIYNYIELRRDLEAKGYTFLTHSDCEPLLYAYQEYGLDFLHHVEGMFAFALYDKVREQLILARDRLGIKPLFISITQEGVYFGSELKALFRLIGQTPELNPAGLAQYLQNGFNTGKTTLCAGIERVLPGEALCIGRNGVSRRWQYWSLLDVKPLDITFADASQEFDSLMERVMQQHIRSDVPFGLFLSGGIDSSILLSLLSRYTDQPLRTYSVGFPTSSVSNELGTAQEVAAVYRTHHTALELDQHSVFSRTGHAVWAADELMSDDANLPVSILAERAACDLKVVFSGEGGDEVFAGYGRYRRSRLQRWLKELLMPGSGGFRTTPVFNRALQCELFSQKLLAVAPTWRQPFVEHWQETPSDWTDLQRMQYVDIKTWLPDDLLVKADRMMMAWGIEGRVPFLDHRVVEFGLALPDHLKVEGRTGKVFLRRWAERVLKKQDHLWRRKSGFTVPIRGCLDDATLEKLRRLLPAQAAIHEWLTPKGVNQLIERQRRQGDATQHLWRILQFAVWHRLFIEGDGIMPNASENPLVLLAHTDSIPKPGIKIQKTPARPGVDLTNP